ncbi:unnamed protein product [Haemonchus placei]|uniref:Major sperm protein n=1 Tax=Haemonchus placei TaxID=6290 RepID=A0A0N4W851_HAEPC|nr:unnamed protein product [Haemonchus placei]
MEKSIRRFCQIDPLMFFAFPPKSQCFREEPTVVQPTLDLHVYPPFAEFIEFGGASKHVLTNAGSSRMVFKVKCSNNSLFKVSPVYAFLDSGASMELQVNESLICSSMVELLYVYQCFVNFWRI